MKLTTIVSLIAALALASAAFAGDAVRNAVEKSNDRQDVRQDRAAVADDQADLNRLSDLIIQYDDLAASGANEQELSRVRAAIASELRRDLVENKSQMASPKKEVGESKRELRSDRREVRSDRHDVRAGDATEGELHRLRDDRRDRRDDRRDVRDDKQDLEKSAGLLRQKREVAVKLRALQGDIDRGGNGEALLAQQKDLLHQYLTLSRAERNMDLQELSEDHRELREDRRETREDRREVR